MSEIKQIELEIVRNLEIINNATEQNNKLRSELEQLELTNWSPDIGEFIVETTGKIFNKLDSGFCREFMILVQLEPHKNVQKWHQIT